MDEDSRTIVALDVDSLAKADSLAGLLAPHVAYFKVGLELLTSEGAPQVMDKVYDRGGGIFFDGKFADIPNTVARASRAVLKHRADMFNVHCLGGPKMMQAARDEVMDAFVRQGGVRPLVLGVTLLTSLDYGDLVQMKIMPGLNIADPEEQAQVQSQKIESFVQNLAWLAQESGLDGVIASPQEIRAIRDYCGPDFLIVTPGIRPAESSADDQKRIATPAGAIQAGADYLVIGRPITQAEDPVAAAEAINNEVAQALKDREGE